MRCQVENCAVEVSDILAYKQIGGTEGESFEIAFCVKHAQGLRAFAQVLKTSPGVAPPPITMICQEDKCFATATQKVVDDRGGIAAIFCDTHATAALARMTGTPLCSVKGCGQLGTAVEIVNPSGTSAFFYCAAHGPAAEKAALATGAKPIPGPVPDRCLARGCEGEATIHGSLAGAMWCEKHALDPAAQREVGLS